MRGQIKVSPLARPIREGDWHDKPLKWAVNGPAKELQNFATKKDALLYARIRRRSATAKEAGRQFVNEALG